MKRYLFIIIIIILHTFGYIMACPIVVSTQEQFDNVVERINNGVAIDVKLKRGNYVLKKSLIAYAPVSITGNDAIISFSPIMYKAHNCEKSTNTHYVHKIASPISLFALFYDQSGAIIPISESVLSEEKVNYVEGIIDAPNSFDAGANIKIPIPPNLKHLTNKTFSSAFGYFDNGWRVINFRLDHSDASLFYCTTLDKCVTGNYMYDKKVYNKPVRFVIYNAEIDPNKLYYDENWLYIPKGINTIYCLNSKDLGSFIPSISFNSDVALKGISFLGFADIKVNSKKNDKCSIVKCTFRNSLGDALSITKEGGLDATIAHINKCLFESCSIQAGYMVRLSSNFTGSPCIKMDNCILGRYPSNNVSYKNTFGVVKINGDVLFSNNIVYNTCRDNIYCRGGQIIVKQNFFYNSDGFNQRGERNFSSDWGQVYCSGFINTTDEALDNKTDCIIVDNNLFYGPYAYGGDARGIFIDDGRGNVECYRNIILNTQDYSIDSRNVSKHKASSVRNKYIDNITTTNYRLASGSAVSGDNLPIVKGNYLIGTSKRSVISNVKVISDDIEQQLNAYCISDDGYLKVSKELYNRLKKSRAWSSLSSYIKKMNRSTNEIGNIVENK